MPADVVAQVSDLLHVPHQRQHYDRAARARGWRPMTIHQNRSQDATLELVASPSEMPAIIGKDDE